MSTDEADTSIQPKPVSDIELVFPANAERDLMPTMEEIPEEFHNHRGWETELWRDIFYYGLDDIQLLPYEHIDPETAWRHLNAICGSYAPKHEHKEACLAYLTNLWFHGAEWTPKGGEKKSYNFELVGDEVEDGA